MYMMFIAAKRSNDTYIGPLGASGKETSRLNGTAVYRRKNI